MTLKTYLAKTPIMHDGKPVAPGDPVELDDTLHAPQLLAVDAIEPAPAPEKKAAK